MKEKLKAALPGIIGVIVIIALVFLASQFSCISKPELLKNESMTCFEARMFVYYAKAGFGKNQLPESTTTKGVEACFAKMRRDDCQTELMDFLKKYNYDPNKYDIQNVSLYNNAQLSFKDCLINSSK